MAFWIVDAHPEVTIVALNEYIRLWIRYPWFYAPPKYELQTNENTLYVYGELAYDSNVNDEWLMTRILWEFLQLVDSFIYLWDSTDGEYLLVELYETRPTWLEPSTSKNRCWLHHGKLYLSEKDTGRLLLQEAIKMIKVGLFDNHQELSEALARRLKPAEHYYTDLIYNSPKIRLSKDIASHFYHHPWLISRSILVASESNFESMEVDHDEEEYTVGIPALAMVMAQYHADLLSNLLTNWLNNGFHALKDQKIVPHVSAEDTKIDLSRDSLQQELITSGKLSAKVPENKQFFNKNYKPPIEQEEIAAHLRDMVEKSENTQEAEDADQSDVPGEFSDGPDLDDFFEYFCKHELKLSDEQVQSFVSSLYSRKREYNDDSDYSSNTD